MKHILIFFISIAAIFILKDRYAEYFNKNIGYGYNFGLFFVIISTIIEIIVFLIGRIIHKYID